VKSQFTLRKKTFLYLSETVKYLEPPQDEAFQNLPHQHTQLQKSRPTQQ